jgi:hypothetical protein
LGAPPAGKGRGAGPRMLPLMVPADAAVRRTVLQVWPDAPQLFDTIIARF